MRHDSPVGNLYTTDGHAGAMMIIDSVPVRVEVRHADRTSDKPTFSSGNRRYYNANG